MKRKIYNQLLEWKQVSNGHSAAVIEGARRIGKSYIVEQFAKNEYQSYILVDFNHLRQDELDLFEHYLNDTEEFLRMLQMHYGVQLINRQSCIIFDEVQQYPKARAAIKYLVADGRYDYIETGSLIRIKKNVQGIVIPSEETSIKMFPMDFEEWLWANGDEMTMPYITECFQTQNPVGTYHRKVMEMWRLYMLIGGMPQVVQTWVETRDFRKVEVEKRTILNLYENDIRQYASGAESKAAAIFEDLPGQLQRHARYFQMSDLGANARYKNYESAFFWLHDSGIVNICWNTTEPSIGLKLNTDRTRLKCYMGDTGLLISMAFDENGQVPAQIYEKVRLGKLEANLGMVVENMVAQMLKAKNRTLFFYCTSETKPAAEQMEIDFLIRKDSITTRHNICPIEVKSGRKGFSVTSLEKLYNKYQEQLTSAIVLSDMDVCVKNGIHYYPLYMAACL